MNKVAKYLTVAASLLLVLMYVFPIWSIKLEAPQYPEGLGMFIWVNDITGQSPNDLNNINLVNHYIGMKHIDPALFPELKYMPYIVLFIIVFGLITAFKGSKKMLWLWLAVFILLALVGLYDFYRWNYNYGHNLDLEKAAIKIPNMTYQPPIFGRKTMLNFVAYSFPALGGIAAFVSMFLGMAAVYVEKRKIS